MKKIFSLIAFFVLTLMSGKAWADSARIYINDFSVEPGEEIELTVMVEADVYVTQAQFFLEIPEGFEFVNKGTERRPAYVSNTGNSAGLACSANIIDNQLRVFLSDADQIGTEEKSGELAIIYLKAKESTNEGEYIFKLTDVVASDEKATRFATPDADIKATVVNVSNGIKAVLDGKARVDVYTLQGEMVGQGMVYSELKSLLRKGVYIAGGTKILIR